jgi:holin-like protein
LTHIARKSAQWLAGAALLLACELSGRAIANLISLPIPGSVIGMLLLLLALMIYGRVPRGLGRVSEQLLRYLVLIFLPAAAGVFFLRGIAPGDWLALAAAMIFGTLISLTLSALLLNRLIRGGAGRAARKPADG